MHLPASLQSCRTRPSPAIRSSLCRSTPQPRTTCRGFTYSAFRRDRSKKNSKRCSSKANEETQQNCDRAARKKWCRPPQMRRGDVRVGSKCEILAKSRCFLLCLQQQTSLDRVGRFVRCPIADITRRTGTC